MSKVSIKLNETNQSVDVQVNRLVSEFTLCRKGVEVAINFANLFNFLLNPALSKKRLAKLQKDMENKGKNGK